MDWEKAHEFLSKNDFDRAGYYIDRLGQNCPDSSDLLRMRADMLIGTLPAWAGGGEDGEGVNSETCGRVCVRVCPKI